MALHVGVGTSRDLQNAFSAGDTAGAEALKRAGGRADIAVIIASSMYDQEEMLRGVRNALPDVSLVGCTSAGAITGEGAHEGVVAVMALATDAGKVVPIKVTGIGKDMRTAGRAFGEAVRDGAPGSPLAFIFSDALSGNGTEMVRGVLDILGSDFRLAGGAAGDDMNFKKTHQYFNGEVLTDAAVGFALPAGMIATSAAGHGWEPIGNPRIVTKAEGTTLYTLDDKPAFEIYRDYFGDRAGDFKSALSLAAVSYPLGMKNPGSDKFMIRVPLSVKDDGSIVCGAEVIEGSEVYLMIGTLSSALWAAEATTKALMEGLERSEQRVMFVSDCVARKILFGERGSDELALLKSIGGPNTELFGFYSYGQIAPIHPPATDVNTCDPGFYEQSVSVTIFGE